MQVPKGYTSTIKVPVPEDLTAQINIVRNGTALPPLSVESEGGVLNIVLPYAATHHEGEIEVRATFYIQGIPYTRSTKVEVYTPYLELHELKEIVGAGKSDQEYWDAELAAHHVINAHCGQDFGLFEGTIKVMSNYNEALPLPRRLINPEKILAGTIPIYDVDTPSGAYTHLGENQFEVTGSGWFLKRPKWANQIVIGDTYSSDPIEYPYYRGTKQFDNDVVYTITGTFGYDPLPSAIRDAAKILTDQYACQDREYREQYLESIKSADWRIQFNSGAYRRTGNARADKLLSEYVIFRAKVI